MFGTLFLKECGQIVKSLTFYIFLVVLIFFYSTQMGSFETLDKPEEGNEATYGMKPSGDKNRIMASTLAMLADNYENNSYTAYPVGFYKQVVLNEEKKEKVNQILQECTGLEDGFSEAVEREELPVNELGTPVMMQGVNQGQLVPADTLTYDRFLDLMEQVDDLLGGGSDYARDAVINNAQDPMSYEEAMAEYEASLKTDRVSKGYARLFCDYMGIILSLLPVFLAVTRSVRDKRAQASQVIYARRVSSVSVVLSRYLSTVALAGLPVLLLSIMPLLQCIYYGKSLGVSVDMFAYLSLFFGWLLPTIAVVTALGFFLSELTSGPAAILIQGVWWLISVFANMNRLVGGVGWNLVPRFNSKQETAVWLEVFPQMVRNRIFYSILAVVLVMGTVGIYHLKRKGVLGNGRKLFGNRQRVS